MSFPQTSSLFSTRHGAHGAARRLSHQGPKMLEGDFAPNFPLKHQQKAWKNLEIFTTKERRLTMANRDIMGISSLNFQKIWERYKSECV